MNLQTQKEKDIAKPWEDTSIDIEKVKQHTRKFFAIFSDNDDVVSINNKELFEQKLGAKIIVEHNKGHFSGDDGITKLPIALESILKL